MMKISREKVIHLHELMVSKTGGDAGLRDLGLLDSALEAAYATFDGVELFPTKEEKAARMGVGLVSNHAFVDGNKRIGLFIMLIFLELNGVLLKATNDELISVGLSLAGGSMKYPELLEWLKAHK
ncbi:MAG: type II toxin-antitoxin system death-on-curing family toxin [Clostridia bacterium]|nr:type II toxin-antitoxin system death-on-curing family toxin [Clostridia bacterium]